MHLIPPWAPNVHPLVIHFPIVLVMLAALADVVHLVRPRLGTIDRIGTASYALGAVSAVAALLTGRAAAREVFMPGMAHVLVDSHRSWALVTAGAFVAVAALRVGSQWARRAETFATRILFVGLGLAVMVLVHQTAERGARLVYEQGVGVIPGAVPGGARGADRDDVGESVR